METKSLERPRSKAREKSGESQESTRNAPEKPDVRELRGTGGIRPDYDYKALRTESA